MRGAAPTGPLLERGEELARIESALAEVRGGRGRFVLIEGPAGIGKTALLGRRGQRLPKAGCVCFAHAERSWRASSLRCGASALRAAAC